MDPRRIERIAVGVCILAVVGVLAITLYVAVPLLLAGR